MVRTGVARSPSICGWTVCGVHRPDIVGATLLVRVSCDDAYASRLVGGLLEQGICRAIDDEVALTFFRAFVYAPNLVPVSPTETVAEEV